MKSTDLICGEDSDEEFQELRALIEQRHGNKRTISVDLGVSVDILNKKLKEHGLSEMCKETALDSKLRFRLPID